MTHIRKFWTLWTGCIIGSVGLVVFSFSCANKVIQQSAISKQLKTRVVSKQTQLSVIAPPYTNRPLYVELNWEIKDYHGNKANGYPTGFSDISFSFEHRASNSSAWLLYVKTNIASIRAPSLSKYEQWRVSYNWTPK